MKRLLCLFLALVILLAITACQKQPQPSGHPSSSKETTTAGTTVPSTQATTTAPTFSTPPTTVPTTAPTTTAPTLPPVTLPPKPEGLTWEFPGEAADPSWFDNTLFIGDSRTTGLKMWYRNGNADYFCDVGMSVFNYESKVLSDNGFTDLSLAQLLESKQYDKIFVNLGLNEAWSDLGAFEQKYQQLYQQLRAAQPEAKLILQGIMSVGPEKAAQAAYYTPQNLAQMSSCMQALANGADTFYIDVNYFFADSQGYLYNEIAASDQCHLTGSGYRLWRDWIAYIVTTLGI